MPTDTHSDLLEKLQKAEELMEEIAVKLENGYDMRSIREEVHELKRVYKALNKSEYSDLRSYNHSLERIESVGTIVEQITAEYKKTKTKNRNDKF